MKYSKGAIIQDTVGFYETYKRAKIDGYSVYVDMDGNKCAFSRYVTAKGLEMLNKPDNRVVLLMNPLAIDLILEEPYKGHEKAFWVTLQYLHDLDYYWDEKGLTKCGEFYVEYLFRRWGEKERFNN